MILDLKKVFDGQGEKVVADCELPVSELEEMQPYTEFASPLSIKGAVTDRARVITLEAEVSAAIAHTCDRCLKAFDREYAYTFRHTLVTAFANEGDEDEYEDYVECPDKKLDIGGLALTDLMLEMPAKILCKEDCKGLCPVCGADLNEGDCGCE